MTIQSQNRTAGPFIGTGVSVSYPFSFKVFNTSELLVVRGNPNGSQTILTMGADYTVTMNTDQEVAPGGTVTLGAPLAVSRRLVITSDLAAVQRVLLTNQGGFYPKVISDALDRLVILIQELRVTAGRAIKLPLSNTGAITELPGTPASYGKAVIVGTDGNITVSDVPFNDQIGIVSGLASDAGTSAAQAAASEGAALVSAGAAQDAAAQLNEILDNIVQTDLTFPLDLGLVSDAVLINKFDLGNLS